MIPALCVRQPYAELIARGIKTEEIRSWSPPRILETEPLLIVASQAYAVGAREIMKRYGLSEVDCPRGVSVCMVRVLGARETDHGWCEEACCDVTDFDLAWGLADASRVARVEIRGRLRLFEVDDGIFRRARTALGGEPQSG